MQKWGDLPTANNGYKALLFINNFLRIKATLHSQALWAIFKSSYPTLDKNKNRQGFRIIMRPFRTFISSTLIIIAVSACSYRMPRQLTHNFTYKYTPDKKDLASLINTNGYYTEIRPDSFYMNYLFFTDGVAIENLYGSDRSSSPDKLPAFLTKMASDTTDKMSLWGTWGTYVISGDTIKAQFIHRSISLNDGWTGWEKHFKVIDREAIKLIYMKPLHKLSASDRLNYTDEFYRQKIKDYQPAVLIKSEGIPKSDCWMKKEKWFWSNEADFNNYISKVGRQQVK